MSNLNRKGSNVQVVSSINKQMVIDNTNLGILENGMVVTSSDEINALHDTLKNAVVDINTAVASGISSALVICAKLAHIKNCELLTETKWSDIRDFAYDMWGFKKSATYSKIAVADRFLTESGALKDEYDYLTGIGDGVLGLLTSTPDEVIHDMCDADIPFTASGIRNYKKSLKESKDEPKTDAPKTDAPKTDAPKTDAPKTDAPKTDAPKTDETSPIDFGVIIANGTAFVVRNGEWFEIPNYQLKDENNVWFKTLAVELKERLNKCAK